MQSILTIKIIKIISNAATIYAKEISVFFNQVHTVNIVNHLKIGFNLGFMPFYEAFILGGSNSVRGYSDGEIGISKSMIQSSFEIRVSKSGYFDKFYAFFDYASDLNSTKELVYNPSDYKLLSGQGSSIGVGITLGSGRIEYGVNTNTLKNFLNFEYGEKY